MTSHDPISAIADQLAAQAEQITRLDTRQETSPPWPSSPTRPPPSDAS